MQKLVFKRVNHHYIIVTPEEKALLVDTGSPVSFCVGNERMPITIGSRDYAIPPMQRMVDDINLSGLIQNRIDGLIGMDLLIGHVFEFDKVNGFVYIDSETNENMYSHSVPIEVVSMRGQKCVAMSLQINQCTLKAVIDTGAWISYLSSSFLNGVETVGMVEDHNPMLGDFKTTKHQVTLSFADYSQDIIVGKMTHMIEMMMSMIDVSFVLGLDSIECDRICLDLKDGELRF